MIKKTISLNQLCAGQCACIDNIQGRPDFVHRLEEFGLLGGTPVEMFRPGNPCIIRLAGNKICLRSDELVNIQVVPLSHD